MVLNFLDDLLTAVDEAGIPCPAPPEPAMEEFTLGPNTGDDAAPPPHRKATYATERRARNIPMARQLRENGAMIEIIARKLGVSERTVYNYLMNRNPKPPCNFRKHSP